MKKQLLTVVVAAACVGVPVAFAADTGFYVGASVGQSTLNEVPDIDDTDIGWKLFAGYQLAKYFAIEGTYFDAGEWEVNYVSASIEAQTWGLSAVGILPLNESFSLFGKLGYHMWEAELSSPYVSASDDGSDLSYGLGASYKFGENFAVRAEWERFEMDDVDTDLLSIGASYHF